MFYESSPYYNKRACIKCGKLEWMGTNRDKCNSCSLQQYILSNKGCIGLRKLEDAGIVKECLFCESTENIETHHIDADRQNNRLENLTFLCKECHGKIHKIIFPPIRKRFYKIMHSLGLRAKTIALTTGDNLFKIKKIINEKINLPTE